MTDIPYLQKQARICRELAAEVEAAEAVKLTELASAYEQQVRWLVAGHGRTVVGTLPEPANDPATLGPDF